MSFNPEILLPDQSDYHYLPYPNSPGGRGRTFIKYYYRALDGALFSTVARNLGEAQDQRDRWLAERELVAAIRAGHLNRSGMVAL